MTDRHRRSWRASAATLVGVTVFAIASGGAVPVLAYLIYRRQHSPWIPGALCLLAVLALLYAWRFGFHPRLRASSRGVAVINPFSRRAFPWEDITLIAPGENGLLVGTEEDIAEAWCVQKSNAAARRGRFTRADQITHDLLDILDEHDPPLEDEETGLRIRRARPDEARLLTRLERAAAEPAVAHLFSPDDPYPVAAVTRRWRVMLHDPQKRVRVLELDDAPVGFLAFDAETVLRLGVLPHHTRRGYGSALIEFACEEIYATGTTQASLWVLSGNEDARHFFAAHSFVETDDRRPSSYPPGPELRRLTRRNPRAPRRSR